jgi:hypothetical protein
MSLSAGLDMPVRLKANSGASAFDFVATGLTGEYRFGPYSGLRMAFNYNTPSKKDADYSYLSLSADYLFDFTTLMRGYTSDRKWDVGIAVGPVYGFMSGSFEDVYSRKHRYACLPCPHTAADSSVGRIFFLGKKPAAD